MKKICLTLITFTFLFIQLGLAHKTWAASPTVIKKNTTVQTQNNNNCQIKFGWLTYKNNRDLFYGSWDGSYTVFLYREGQTRDQYVAKETTRDTSVKFNNLVPNQDYDAEVFLTGAFVAAQKPYWEKFRSLECRYETFTQTTNKTKVNQISIEQGSATIEPTIEELPDTGWELWYFILIPAVLFSVGKGLSSITKFMALRKS